MSVSEQRDLRTIRVACSSYDAVSKYGHSQEAFDRLEQRLVRYEEALKRITTVEGEYLKDWDAIVEVSVGFLQDIALQALIDSEGIETGTGES